MHFWKYCGAGNDFVILENFDGSIAPERYAALAAALCREHFSVGADGLMVLEPPAQGGDCRMRFYNRDGSTAEMCGNGARCLCRHCHDRGLASGPVQRIETPAGLVTGRRIAADRYRIRLNRPSVVRLHVEAEGVRCAYLELGEPGIPHAVVLTELDRPRAELRELAARLRVRFGRRVLGPMTPPVDRIRGEYLAGLLLKIESGASSARARELLAAELKTFSENPAFKAIAVIVNVDPQ